MPAIYELDTTQTPNHAANVQQTVALELALGVSLPDEFAHWPLGLVAQWNGAAAANRFDDSATFGDLARAFIDYRSNELKRSIAA